MDQYLPASERILRALVFRPGSYYTNTTHQTHIINERLSDHCVSNWRIFSDPRTLHQTISVIRHSPQVSSSKLRTKRATTTLVIVSSVFLFCWLPYTLLVIINECTDVSSLYFLIPTSLLLARAVPPHSQANCCCGLSHFSR